MGKRPLTGELIGELPVHPLAHKRHAPPASVAAVRGDPAGAALPLGLVFQSLNQHSEVLDDLEGCLTLLPDRVSLSRLRHTYRLQ